MAAFVGCIYILTNPSFPNYVKIGYTDNLNDRVKQLNASTAVPFEFRIYATYAVTKRCDDHEIHKLIDTLNPDLRAVEEKANGKIRKREFYAIAPEDAYNILNIIATISGTTDRLKKYQESSQWKEEKVLAEEIEDTARARRENFSFEKCNIPIGSEVVFVQDETKKCRVISDRKVEYDGNEYYLSSLATRLTGKKNLPGPFYFKYNGNILNDIYNSHNNQNT